MSSNNDYLTRFILDGANVRGALVKLNDTWQNIANRADYPPAIAQYLAQCCVASALFASSIKIDGRLSIHLRGAGYIRTLFAECTTQGTLRGIAHFNTPVPEHIDIKDFGSEAVLAITIENQGIVGREPQRYQGLVGLQEDSLYKAFEMYFEQSEQLPTRLFLFNNQDQAAGILIQQMPNQTDNSDNWQRAQLLLETSTAEELFSLTANEMLYRLFHEENIRILDTRNLAFACSCSRERVQEALISLGKDEIEQTVEENGELTVHCDFCGQAYHFTKEQGISLFWPKPIVSNTPRLH
jgi:molecular chaperone Hsp33